MAKRFVERFQLWMREVADEREDKFIGWILFAAIAMVASDAYAIFSAHRVSLDGLVGTVLFVAFVILYLRKARFSWVILAVLALRCLVYIPFEYFHASSRSGVGVGLFVAVFLLALAGAAFVFSLIVRKRFANSTRTI
jgi:hypothetical protein